MKFGLDSVNWFTNMANMAAKAAIFQYFPELVLRDVVPIRPITVICILTNQTNQSKWDKYLLVLKHGWESQSPD